MQWSEAFKKIPTWGWAVIGVVVGVVGLFFLRRPAASTPISLPAEPQPTGPAPSPGAGTGSTPEPVDLSPLLAAIGELGTLQAQQGLQLQNLARWQSTRTRKAAQDHDETMGGLGVISQQVAAVGVLAAMGLEKQLTPVPETGDVVTPGRTAPAGVTPGELISVSPVGTATQAWQQPTKTDPDPPVPPVVHGGPAGTKYIV